MYGLLGPLMMIGIFSSIILMSVHDPAKFQQYSMIFAKSAADTKNSVFPGLHTFYGRHCRCSGLCEAGIVMSSQQGAQLIWGNPGGSGNWNGEGMGVRGQDRGDSITQYVPGRLGSTTRAGARSATSPSLTERC